MLRRRGSGSLARGRSDRGRHPTSSFKDTQGGGLQLSWRIGDCQGDVALETQYRVVWDVYIDEDRYCRV
jgi:hypothetical protein